MDLPDRAAGTVTFRGNGHGHDDVAALTAFLFGLAYFGTFGTYYFVDAFVPAAVFLGRHLLFTDPSTSPRTELGRVLFGVLYCLGVVAPLGLLGWLGALTFYDKPTSWWTSRC